MKGEGVGAGAAAAEAGRLGGSMLTKESLELDLLVKDDMEFLVGESGLNTDLKGEIGREDWVETNGLGEREPEAEVIEGEELRVEARA